MNVFKNLMDSPYMRSFKDDALSDAIDERFSRFMDGDEEIRDGLNEIFADYMDGKVW